jgi:hypothetical protein
MEGKDIKHYIHGNFVGSELFTLMDGSCSFTVAIQLKIPMEIYVSWGCHPPSPPQEACGEILLGYYKSWVVEWQHSGLQT